MKHYTIGMRSTRRVQGARGDAVRSRTAFDEVEALRPDATGALLLSPCPVSADIKQLSTCRCSIVVLKTRPQIGQNSQPGGGFGTACTAAGADATPDLPPAAAAGAAAAACAAALGGVGSLDTCWLSSRDGAGSALAARELAFPCCAHLCTSACSAAFVLSRCRLLGTAAASVWVASACTAASSPPRAAAKARHATSRARTGLETRCADSHGVRHSGHRRAPFNRSWLSPCRRMH